MTYLLLLVISCVAGFAFALQGALFAGVMMNPPVPKSISGMFDGWAVDLMREVFCKVFIVMSVWLFIYTSILTWLEI